LSSATGDRPQWRTGWLWGVLALFLVFGAVGLATVVFGVTLLWAGSWLGLVFAAGGGFGALLAFLFTAGILYRVDRYRGTLTGRVELFE
jgi:hypothetical protein